MARNLTVVSQNIWWIADTRVGKCTYPLSEEVAEKARWQKTVDDVLLFNSILIGQEVRRAYEALQKDLTLEAVYF